MGFTPHGIISGLYVDGDGDFRTSQGQSVELPACARCADARYVKVRPLSRPSRGGWDWELMGCAECS